jgi:hypothetical protein
MAADLLERVRAELDARLAELRPAVAEYERLLGATDMLRADADADADADATTPTPVTERRATAKPRAAAKARAATKPARPATKPAKPRRATKPAKPRTATKPAKRRAANNPAPQPLGAGERAIVAALEHGSHTIGELGIVTAMSGADIRESARRLLAVGKVVRAKRDGRAAYALSGKA